MKKGILLMLSLAIALAMTACLKTAEATQSTTASAVVTTTAEMTTKASSAPTTAETTVLETTRATESVDPSVRKAEIQDSIVQIESLKTSEPNSASGIDLEFTAKNMSEKEIKYLTAVFEFYNAVGDVVASDIGGGDQFGVRLTGPTAKNELIGTGNDGSYWPAIIYNSTVKKAHLGYITIEYMDGTVTNLEAEDCNILTDWQG